jgi:subtilase family serine protease
MRYVVLLVTLAASSALLLATLHQPAKAQARLSGDGLPDLIVSDIQQEWQGGNGCLVSHNNGARVWVRNIGVADAGPFVVDFDGQQLSVDAGLAAGETTSLWFPWFGYYNHAIVDATFIVTESNEDNNTGDTILVTATPPSTCTPTPMPTSTPTPTPTTAPSDPVGGIADLPDAATGAAESGAAESDSSRAPYLAIAGAAAAVVFGAGALYARRRRGGY